MANLLLHYPAGLLLVLIKHFRRFRILALMRISIFSLKPPSWGRFVQPSEEVLCLLSACVAARQAILLWNSWSKASRSDTFCQLPYILEHSDKINHLIIWLSPVIIHAAWPTSVKLNSWWHFLGEKTAPKSRGLQDRGITPKGFLMSHYPAVWGFWQQRH